ncbi:uncharacterized protein PV09_03431 [Verruconis gallopava]|uniref:ATP-dependent DNA helicase CHL1 n=1 Tax=Verruconis gallopava TaxID=253628 RepID=A0A0D2AF26_9PEZI|nr:uncharacterized protein PV09_03431 [Verruconis gallopava]KIW05553.1 hypothetical protein PV09_03431 [Verruconis gallopava]
MAPRNFHHPYEPYPIQTQFMTAVYECIEQGKIGIFESPTGTGKSLSLICGSLTWLRNHKAKDIEASLEQDEPDIDEPDWIVEHARKERRARALQHRQDLEARLARIRQNELNLQKKYERGEPPSKRQKTAQVGGDEEGGEDQYILDDYESDNERQGGRQLGAATDYGVSTETQAILKRLGMFAGMQAEEDDMEMPDELKIFYCSRTHSQLSQFANELRRVRIPPILVDSDVNRSGEDDVSEGIKHLTLGARKNLCIHPKVSRLSGATAINERCLELQQAKTSPDRRCPYLPKKEDQALVNNFRDHALAKIRDIEDLGNVGRRIGICPYYAARTAIKPSEIVTLPYPLLLQKTAREALDISLKNHVIIIDEAHNLMDAITAMYSASISLTQLELGRSQLILYLSKFRNRLKGKNRVYVTQIVRVLDSLISYLKAENGTGGRQAGVVPVSDLMSGKGVDQINLFKLSKYIQESRLARKVDGYVEFTEKEAQKSAGGKASHGDRERSTPVLTLIENFLMALMNPSKEGRFFLFKAEDDQGVGLQYMLLDPTFHFRDIVDEARAVILAGGTMSPMDDYIKHLFPYVPAARIMTLSCDHVIPPSNLLAWSVARDSAGHEFSFTFQNRASGSTMHGAGRTLIELARAVPDGVVAFFSSYAYLDACVKAWREARSQHAPASMSLWDELNSVKPVFLEPRSSSSSSSSTGGDSGSSSNGAKPSAAATEALLASFAKTISESTDGRGALLLSVVNGSLSEGINFSDRLGRAVVVFGLPFPNAQSAEWKARMEYVAAKEDGAAGGKAAAQEFYENATMRAVNQAVGRAIRHRNDYACIFLIDRRYGSERIQGKLPGWIRGSLRTCDDMREVLQGTRAFFAAKRDGQSR